jgi:hypothetical protein
MVEGIDKLDDFSLGFVEAILYRMGIDFGQATPQQFAGALGELRDYIRRHRPDLEPPSQKLNLTSAR